MTKACRVRKWTDCTFKLQRRSVVSKTLNVFPRTYVNANAFSYASSNARDVLF